MSPSKRAGQLAAKSSVRQPRYLGIANIFNLNRHSTPQLKASFTSLKCERGCCSTAELAETLPSVQVIEENANVPTQTGKEVLYGIGSQFDSSHARAETLEI